MGGISILPSGSKYHGCACYHAEKTELRYSVSYSINEDLRARVCSVLNGIIDDEHLSDLHLNIFLPLLIIILRIYVDLAKWDLEAKSFLDHIRIHYYQEINSTPKTPCEVILSQIFRSADLASASCILRLDNEGQSNPHSQKGIWVQFYFFELLVSMKARLWLRYRDSLITIDLLAGDLSDVSSRLWFPGQSKWEPSAGVQKNIKHRAEF